MDLEERYARALIATFLAGTLGGISGGALVAWLTGVTTVAGGVWFYTGGGLLGALAAGAYAVTRRPEEA
jgi:hypothetical protein